MFVSWKILTHSTQLASTFTLSVSISQSKIHAARSLNEIAIDLTETGTLKTSKLANMGSKGKIISGSSGSLLSSGQNSHTQSHKTGAITRSLPVYSYHPEITSWHEYKVLFVVRNIWSYLGDIMEKLWDGRKNVHSLAKVLRSSTNVAFARKQLQSLCNNTVLPWETLHSLNSPPRNVMQNSCILLHQYCIPWDMLRSLAKHCVLSQNDWSPDNICILLQMFFNIIIFCAKLYYTIIFNI